MPFLPENELEQALISSATDPVGAPAFYRKLLESDIFIVPAGRPPEIVDGTVQSGSSLHLHALLRNGVNFTPFFTSVSRIQAVVKEETGYLQMGAKAFLEMTAGAHLVLNPGSDYGKEFLPGEVARLMDGSLFKPQETYVVPKAQQVTIGRPAQYPTELVAALKRHFSSQRAVQKAYLVQYVNPARQPEPGLLVSVAIDKGANPETIFGEVGVIIRALHPHHKFIDFVRHGGTGISGHLEKEYRPFYERGFLKGLLG